MLRRALHIFLINAIVLALAVSCAQESRPGGGPPDKKGPELKAVFPKPGSTYFKGNEVTLHFDEYLKPGSYASEIFISPVLPVPPRVITVGKSISIKFPAALRENTTYVIHVGTGVADFNAGNKLDSAITLAFSTGEKLDSLKFSGRVTNAISGSPESDVRLLLFDAAETPWDSIYGHKPLYASQALDDGTFHFNYLRPGTYFLVGIKETDNTYSISSSSEPIAFPETQQFLLDSSLSTPIQLRLFTPDRVPPSVRSAKWVTEKLLLLEMKERVSLVYKGDSARFLDADTSMNEMTFIRNFSIYESQPGQVLLTPAHDCHDTFDLHIANLADSAGNRLDTILRILPEMKVKSFWKEKCIEPVWSQEKGAYLINSTSPLRQYFEDSLISVTDSAGRKVKHTFVSDNLLLEIRIQETPGPPPYTIRLKEGLPFRDGSRLSEAIRFSKTDMDLSRTGAISGRLSDADFQGEDWLVQLLNDKKEFVMQSAGRTFSFHFLAPGKYSLRVVKDEDQNGRWSSGTLSPRTLPEKVFFDSRTIDVRAGWEQEDYEVKAQASAKGKKEN